MHEGDPYRLKAIREVVAKCGVRAFVETGAWKGDTIIWAAETFPHLDAYMTCEAYAPHFDVAWERTRGLERVSCSPTPSPQFLEDLPADLPRPALFYLDAHWPDYWPLRDEIAVVSRRWLDAVVLVDDAFVPGRPCFIGCRGGGGAADKALGGRKTTCEDGEWLDVHMIRAAFGPDWRLFFPNYEATSIGYAICARRGGADLDKILGKDFMEW
jgi:hypothetical protein